MSLVDTRLQNWRVQNPELDKNMARPAQYGALDFFIEETNNADSIISKNLKERAFNSIGNTVQVPVLKFDSNVQVSNTRTCVIADDENTSALYTVVWKTYQVGFTMVPALYMNNEISYRQDFARKMDKVSRALANALDKDAVAALEAQKTQVLKDNLNYKFTANVLEIPTTMATEILGDIDPIMRANDYPGTVHIIGNARIDSLINKLAQHGIYNDVNRRLEFENKIFHFTNNVTNERGKNGTFFAVEGGNVGILTRVDREAARGTESNGHKWGVTRVPYFNEAVGYHYYTEVGNQSASAGDATEDLVCGVKEFYGFSVDVAFVVGYNSDAATVANPIIKANIAALAENQPMATPVFVTNAAEFKPGV